MRVQCSRWKKEGIWSECGEDVPGGGGKPRAKFLAGGLRGRATDGGADRVDAAWRAGRVRQCYESTTLRLIVLLFALWESKSKPIRWPAKYKNQRMKTLIRFLSLNLYLRVALKPYINECRGLLKE